MTAVICIVMMLLAAGIVDNPSRPFAVIAEAIAIIGCAFALAVIERGWP